MRGLYRSDFGNARYVNALAKRHRPYSLSRPRAGPSFMLSAVALTGLRRDKPPAQYRGRAGRQGSNWTRGPRRLATSRPVEVLCASPAALVRAKRQGVPQVRQTLGVPRAVFNRL